MIDLKSTTQNKFKSDFEKLLELSKSDKFTESISEFLIKEFEGWNNKKNNLKLDYFVIYWNRNSENLSIIKRENRTQMELFPFDNDLVSNFSLFSSSIKGFLKDVIHKTNSSKLDINSVKEYVKKKLSKELSELQITLLEAQIKNNFYDLLNTRKNGAIIPIDYLDENSQFKHYWSYFFMFDIKEGNKDYFDDNKVFLSYQIWRGKKDSVSGHLTDENGKLYKPFIPYKNQLLDYGLKIILDFNQPSKNKNILLRFLKENIEEGEAYESLLEQFKEGLKNQKVKDSCQKLKDLVNNKSFNGALDYNKLFDFYELDEDLLGKSFIKDLESLILVEVKDFAELKPFTYCKLLPEKIYKLLKRNVNLLESFDTDEEVLTACKTKGSKVYSPYYHNIIFHSGNENIFLKTIKKNPFMELEQYLVDHNFKTTVKVKEEIKLLLNFSTVTLTENERNHLNFVLQMNTVDL